MRVLYRILVFLSAPIWLLFLALRHRGEVRLGERLGFYPEETSAPIWIQAVSVGELRIAQRLAAVFRKRGLPVLISSTTSTGLKLAAAEARDAIGVRAFPLDLPYSVSMVLRRIKPRALVLVETELWPELFAGAKRDGVPVFIANARLSDRAFKRTLVFKRLYSNILRGVRVAAQSEEHAARFGLLGANPKEIVVLGNLKYDLAPPGNFETVREQLRGYLPGGSLWTAGSVREGEEALVLQAMLTLRTTLPGVRLLLAPRHLSRVDVSLKLCERAGLRAALRSRGVTGNWDVLLLDTVGELWSAYALASAAFVGGSLVSLGGQNVLEPAFLGKPVLFGPHTENFKDAAEGLLSAGGAVRVKDPVELGRRLGDFLADPAAAEACGLRAKKAVERHRGAVGRTARWIADNIEGV